MLRQAIYGLTCLATVGTALAGSPFDGVYTGTMVLTNGSAPSCLPSGGVTITISGNDMKLVDSRSVRKFVLELDPALDGSFIASYEDLADGVVDVRGGIAGNVVDADTSNYGNGCAHHIHVEKSGPKNSK
jgi:hypothetical protein